MRQFSNSSHTIEQHSKRRRRSCLLRWARRTRTEFNSDCAILITRMILLLLLLALKRGRRHIRVHMILLVSDMIGTHTIVVMHVMRR